MVNDYTYLCLSNILKGNMSNIKTNDQGKLEHNEVILRSHEVNQEKKVIKSEEFNNLSDEAKEIILTILNCPEEIIDLITTPKLGKFSIKRIRNTFAEMWNSKLIADSAIMEIKRWVRNL